MKNEDLIENAVRSVDINFATPSYSDFNEVNMGHKHAACPHCGHLRIRQVELVKGKKQFQCEKCELLFLRPRIVHSAGPRVAESRSPRIREFLDSDLPDLKRIRNLTRQQRLWLEWAHTSLYSGDREKAETAKLSVKWDLFSASVDQLKPAQREEPAFMVARYMVLLDDLADAFRFNHAMPAYRTLAAKLRVSHDAFDASRTWGQRIALVQSVVTTWEAQICEIMGAPLDKLTNKN